ncbi:hypothetical protein RintRC_2758 [Richelia intracellularis]|nr:hypothetical protein RintRC_2758 [Richelia intracellularis]
MGGNNTLPFININPASVSNKNRSNYKRIHPTYNLIDKANFLLFHKEEKLSLS